MPRGRGIADTPTRMPRGRQGADEERATDVSRKNGNASRTQQIGPRLLNSVSKRPPFSGAGVDFLKGSEIAGSAVATPRGRDSAQRFADPTVRRFGPPILGVTTTF